MKAVILTAGLGTRMRKAYPDTPKSLLPIRGKPLIQDQIDHLKKFGITDFYVNLHFLPDKIKDFLGNGSRFGVRVTYHFEQKILGTAGALNNFKGYLDRTFIVLYGDIFTRVDFNKFLQSHKSKNAQVSLLIHETDHPEDSDLVEIDDDNQIKNIYISPHSQPILHATLSSAAVYILEPDILQFLPRKHADFMKDFFPQLLKRGIPIYGYLSNDFTKDIGTPERYRKLAINYFLKEKKQV